MNWLRRFFIIRQEEKTAAKPFKLRFAVLSILILLIITACFDYPPIWNKTFDWLNAKKNELIGGIPNVPQFSSRPFRLGLDLQGGTHLVYEADLSKVDPKDINDSMQGVRDVIERRVNLFGVTEPVVQIDKTGDHYRLIIELAGIKDVHQAIKMIGETPVLEFLLERPKEETDLILKKQKQGDKDALQENPYFKPTGLTGRFLKSAHLDFDKTTYKPLVNLDFNSEGAKIFGDLTSKNIGKKIAIYLDGMPISIPVVREAITGGKAQITGNFSVEEARQLARRLNAGALPVPIKLIAQETVGASLGHKSLSQSLKAGVWGLIAVGLFMIFYYRLPGFLAVVALGLYVSLVLMLFKLIPVTLTLAGIAGFILSLGMAVDANVLIFERLKEELRSGKSLTLSIDEGFRRAWTSIRDGNVSTLITCIILYAFTSGMVKGFALTLGLGVLVSMLTAVLVTKTFLKYFVGTKLEQYKWFWR